MTDAKQCPQCESTIPAGSEAALCPQCLMQMALKSDTQLPSSLSDEPSSFSAELDMTLSHGGGTAVASAELEVGSQLGSFTLHRKLGEGGMGTVYEAFDEDTQRRVALKVLKHKLNTPEARARFLREGRTAASVNHPNCVYVFGTENIDGKLIISMELVGRGNLQQTIKQNGPMAFRPAVDAILQVIDGLEAAAAVGVLHRDIKPSNCFVDTDGSIKVGDFGLSISTQGTEESFVTRENAVLGTPAFSSPEQLRGDDLDLRSDIYSVGVTLFYLLTGTTPFKANNMVQLLATVLEQPAPSVSTIDSEIPSGLAKIIDRCLAKTPESRWKDYGMLRAALQQFSNESVAPAPLSARFLANLADMIPVFAISAIPIMLLGNNPDYSPLTWIWNITSFAYLGFCEGQFGTSLGKWMLGLRVVAKTGGRAPWRSVLLRTAMFVWISTLTSSLYELFGSQELWESFWVWIVVNVDLVLLCLLFSTVRRGNGMAAVHDLATDIRVVNRRVAPARRPQSKVHTPPLPEADKLRTIGPYDVLQPIDKSQTAEILLAYDSRLLRRVWIRCSSDANETVHRSLNRITRLRWLNTCDDEADQWQAYEAPQGQPLLNVIAKPQPWDSVRGWLTDLATELMQAEQEGTLPDRLSASQLWVTNSGRLKLLDFEAPGLPKGRATTTPQFASTNEGTRDFFRSIAAQTIAADTRPCAAKYARPLHAIDFSGKVSTGLKLNQLKSDLESIASLPARVSRTRRLTMFAIAAIVPLLIFVLLVFVPLLTNSNVVSPVDDFRMDLQSLSILESRASKSTGTPDPKWLELFVASHFGDFVRDENRWHSAIVVRTFNGYSGNYRGNFREQIEEIVARHSQASAEDFATAHELCIDQLFLLPKTPIDETSDPADVTNELCALMINLEQHPKEELRLFRLQIGMRYQDALSDPDLDSLKPNQLDKLNECIAEAKQATSTEIAMSKAAFAQPPAVEAVVNGDPYLATGTSAALFLALVGLPAIVAGLLFRGGLIMRLANVTCITGHGKPAGRLRMCWRAILWTMPALGLAHAMFLALAGYGELPLETLWISIPVIIVSVLVPLLSLLLERSLVDRLSGTYLVPR